MERLKRIIADTVFVVQILIAFIVIFESSMQVPAILQAFGRLHPLLLHLPIGLLLVTVILLFTQKYFHATALDELISLLLHFTALTASFTTLMGLFLALEGTFGADQLWLHKWLGVVLSFLCWSLLSVKNNMRVLRPMGLAGVIILIFTGHFGAALTHGEDFVWAPLQSEEPRVTRVITDSTALFIATVEPILESKCYGCHNRKKAKGDLVLTSLESIEDGGKNGAVWKTGDAAHSLMVERLMLPLDDDEHMPPKDKAQLTGDELNFIALWIDEGADTHKKLNELKEGDTLQKLAALIIPRYQETAGITPLYSFQFAPPEKIEKLSRPNRTVIQIARNEPAVQADFHLRETFDSKLLEELVEVREQLISLNLSNMPVQDDDLKTIAKFQNLEVLNLNNTQVRGQGFKELANLQKLRSLSVSGTEIMAPALRDLGTSKSLKEVFIWNTPIGPEDLASLKRDLPHIHWEIGYVPDEDEVLKLNVPMLKNKSRVLNSEEKVVFKHNLPGTEVRYTLDGSEPDSVNSPVYTDPLSIGNFALIKTKAYKDGWTSSDVAPYILFRQGSRPDSAKLLSVPDERFQGEGAITLIDGNKGLPDFYRHPAWIAFKDNDLEAIFTFEKQAFNVSNVTLSYAHNNNQICLPPDEMQLWGGNDAANLKLIGKLNPSLSKGPASPRIEGISMDVPPSSFKYYKLVAKPVRKHGEGHSKKRSIWLMVDEVFFNQ